MSTINAQNYGDGTNSVPASAVLEGTAKVVLRYNQNTTTVGRDYNVSSVTDNSTGNFTVNFTTAFDAVDHAPLISTGTGIGRVGSIIDTATTDADFVTTLNNAGSANDNIANGVAIYGDLA